MTGPELPPVAGGYIDDRSKWYSPGLKPEGLWGWIETGLMLACCVPVLLAFGPLVWLVRRLK